MLLAASISVTRFCAESRTSTRFATSLSASAVGSPPTSMRARRSFVPGTRASTAAPTTSSTYIVLFFELKTICCIDATRARSLAGFGTSAVCGRMPPVPRLATMITNTAVTAITARAAMPRTGAGR